MSKVTNGEYYDHQLKSWVVLCGSTPVLIRKLDKTGQPVPPPEEKESKS